ncbi:hypothetical protein BH18ACT10_BH18ACT10_04950 [soil metagenome]
MRRTTVLLVAVMIAVALVVVTNAVAPTPADAATSVVTKTFSNSQQITIPVGTSGAATPYPSEKNVSGFKQGTILDVDLTLKNYTHAFPDDVDVLLSKENSGVNRTVMSDVGGSFPVNNITLKLDDEATNGLLPDNGPLVGGRFKPTNVGSGDAFPAPAPAPDGRKALSGFDGLNPNGTWKLRVVDDFPLADGGQFAGVGASLSKPESSSSR